MASAQVPYRNTKAKKEKQKPYWTEVHLGVMPEVALTYFFIGFLLFTIYAMECTDWFPKQSVV